MPNNGDLTILNGDHRDIPLQYLDPKKTDQNANQKKTSIDRQSKRSSSQSTSTSQASSIWQNGCRRVLARLLGPSQRGTSDLLEKALLREKGSFRRRSDICSLAPRHPSLHPATSGWQHFPYNVRAYFFPVEHHLHNNEEEGQTPCERLPVARVTLSFEDPYLFASARFQWRENLPRRVWYDEIDKDLDSHPLVCGAVMYRRTMIMTWLGVGEAGRKGDLNENTWQVKVELWSRDCKHLLGIRHGLRDVVDRLLTREAVVRVQGYYIEPNSNVLDRAPNFYDKWTSSLTGKMLAGVSFGLSSTDPTLLEKTARNFASLPTRVHLDKPEMAMLVEERFEEQFFGGTQAEQAAAHGNNVPVVFAPDGWVPEDMPEYQQNKRQYASAWRFSGAYSSR